MDTLIQAQTGNLELYWDATYAIAVTLLEVFPEQDPLGVSLFDLATMVESLPGFADDPALVTERILLDIQAVWVEEK